MWNIQTFWVWNKFGWIDFKNAALMFAIYLHWSLEKIRIFCSLRFDFKLMVGLENSLIFLRIQPRCLLWLDGKVLCTCGVEHVYGCCIIQVWCIECLAVGLQIRLRGKLFMNSLKVLKRTGTILWVTERAPRELILILTYSLSVHF